MVDGTLAHARDMTETGGKYAGPVWVATEANGTSQGKACPGGGGDWDQPGGGQAATNGHSTAMDIKWSESGAIFCGTPAATYCFEQ